jgi:lipopolysaccharide/colanic/teichoic acid biosynthesis glycosyltransferase
VSQPPLQSSGSAVFEDTQVFIESRGRIWLDRFVAASVLVLASPVMLLVGSAVLASNGWPVLFRQTRIGRQGRPFTLFKFRTMLKNASGSLVTASGDRRITKTGGILRKFKLDEMPQLINVVRGEMSLIGPRPEVAKYVDTRQPVWQEVLRVRPGITDVATLIYRDEEQILGSFSDPEKGYRESVLPDKLSLNLAYLRVRTTVRDLKLLLLTARYSFVRGSVDDEKVRKLLVP